MRPFGASAERRYTGGPDAATGMRDLMPEALTESFCERCGTRYEFQAPTELNPLRKTRGLVSGLKNYIMSQDALGDAIGDAMRTEEQALAAQQLEAFHDAFNFCIDCRQYACTNCWNDATGRCRNCSPIPGKDDLADRLEAAYLSDHAAIHAAEPQLAIDEISRRLGVEAWPTTDLPDEATANDGVGEVAWPGEQVQPETVASAEPRPDIAAERAEPSPEPATPVLAWEDDAELTLRTPIEEALPEPEPLVAEVMPEPELVRRLSITPIREAIVRVPPPVVEASPPVGEEALAARKAQLDLLGLDDPGVGKVAAERTNVLPYRSSGAAVHASELVQRTVGSSSALWDASAREVAAARSAVAVQSCGSCGLSLSASARFCRRCGTQQARSA